MRLKETYNKMPTHKITPSQLRGMIKEALEESLEEISLDDERMELARLGLSRTPEQNRRYKELLEAKLGYMNEALTGSQSAKIGKAFGKVAAIAVNDQKAAEVAAEALRAIIEADEKDKLDVDKIINKLKPMLQTMKKEAKTKRSEGAKEKTPGGFKSGLV